jgi:hypothetical protein
MRILTILTVLMTMILNPAAWADFVVTSMPPPPGSIVDTVPDNLADLAAARFKLAYGFGKQIPLSFAVRQIVPPAVIVSYGPGADSNALVNWRGGRGWNRVLLDAVRPLGLHLVMTHMAVEIRK